ncbi:MAG: 4Fe-4S cluster-binding domain-containing protein [Ruminococcus callidus]
MYYGAIKPCDIANGEGVESLCLFRCRHACKNCFNPETWCFSMGLLYRGNHSTHFRTAETGICERFDTDRRRTDGTENQAVLLKLVQAVRHTFGTQKTSGVILDAFWNRNCCQKVPTAV